MLRNIRRTKGPDGKGLKIAIVVSRFNSDITFRLLEGAKSELRNCRTSEKDIQVLEVPGAFELPQAALQVANCKRVDAIICLGAVIRGETPHFEYVSAESARGIMETGLRSGIPLILGLLTVNNLRQAKARSGGKRNKGREAALAAIEMAILYRQVRKR